MVCAPVRRDNPRALAIWVSVYCGTMTVYYACIFLFDFSSCHAICLLVLVNSDAHIGPGVIINLEILTKKPFLRG